MAEAAGDLAQAQGHASDAFQGFACAAALTAVELPAAQDLAPRVAEAEDLSELLGLQAAGGLRQLYGRELRKAQQRLRRQRLEQWRPKEGVEGAVWHLVLLHRMVILLPK